MNEALAEALSNVKIKGAINSKTAAESCRISGALALPAGLKLNGAAVRLELNDAGADFVLDRTGKARGANGAFKLVNKAGNSLFKATLANAGIAKVLGVDATLKRPLRDRASRPRSV